jgi:pimeloyl-ACP methyl ester carboxylesterase
MSLRRYAALILALFSMGALAASSAAAQKPGRITRVDASCAGDLISGKARISAPAMVSLQLLSRRSARAKFVATRKLAWIRARQAGSYRFRFDISQLDANAYRIRAKSGAQSRILGAAKCGPGYQVPEAPFAVLLPLSLLLGLGLPLGIRRLRRRTALSGS